MTAQTFQDAVIREMGNKGFKATGLGPQGIQFEGLGNGKTISIGLPETIPEDEAAGVTAIVTEALAKVEAGDHG